MTYERFVEIVAKHRPEVQVLGKSMDKTPKIMICFVKDGKQSRVYEYCGSYMQVLNSLKIPTALKSYYDECVKYLEHYKATHGKPSDFWEGELNDWTELIRYYEYELKSMEGCELV